jgi:carbonic anhydrase
MPNVDRLLENNASFARAGFEPLPAIPAAPTVVITCADVRVDPAHTLGLALGEAAVIRNVAGRITPAAVQMLAMLGTVVRSEGGGQDGPFELILMQHTDCGITRLTGYPDLLADYLGVSEAELPAKAVGDPRLGLVADIEALRSNPAIPDDLVVSALVYDVATGKAEPVRAPAPLRAGEVSAVAGDSGGR